VDTITLREYAVQVEMEPGRWTFVMDRTGDAIEAFESRDAVEQARQIWNLDHSRVVSRQIRPFETNWRVS
jgi:hypothetical protein